MNQQRYFAVNVKNQKSLVIPMYVGIRFYTAFGDSNETFWVNLALKYNWDSGYILFYLFASLSQIVWEGK